MVSGCTRTDCTVADTGACLLNHDPSSCPHRLPAEDVRPTSDVHTTRKVPIPSSRACTLSRARDLMKERYVSLVAILGEPEAGKTGCLVSLYLSVAHTKLDGFSFADSRTLMGFEEISQGARRWNDGQVPAQFTDRTALRQGRAAGFLHLRLNRDQLERPVDLLFSDLPGEWTTELVDRNRSERLAFVNRADAIWLVIDGRETVLPEKRQICLQRSKMAIRRLETLLVPGRRLVLVFTRHDLVAPDDGVVRELCSQGHRSGFDTEFVLVASFAQDDGNVPAGSGIGKLVELTTGFSSSPDVVWQEGHIDDSAFECPRIGLVRRATHGS